VIRLRVAPTGDPLDEWASTIARMAARHRARRAAVGGRGAPPLETRQMAGELRPHRGLADRAPFPLTESLAERG
jgi:hypothetical protein